MSQVILNITAPPRGSAQQTAAQQVVCQSIRASFAWGGSPATATMVFVQDNAPNFTGCQLTLQVGEHYFAGICKSDTVNVSSKGNLREMQFVDMREFLAWDYVYCAFNMPVRRFVGGQWVKMWWHIYPSDFDTYTKTWTTAPLTAAQIVGALFSAPTVHTPWSWNLTGNGLFPGGLMNQPIYSFDCLQGVRLDAALNDISSRGGLVFTLDPVIGNPYRLVWMRKGYGLIPVLPPFGWPSNSDERRIGWALSGNPSRVRVLGERNKYLMLNVPLVPDWNRAWEQFLDPDSLYEDLAANATNAQGIPYNNYPNDPEHWQGSNECKARALVITLGEYVDLRNARSGDGDQFADYRKFEGRSRMTMPAALYIEKLVLRAYRPNVGTVTNAYGQDIDWESISLTDSLLCRVTYDPSTGTMAADPSTLADGNGVGIVQGVALGQDLFQLVQPERINTAFFTAANFGAFWTQVSFQIDDAGENQRFIIFDQPVFTSENLLTTVDGYTVMNAQFTLNPAAAQAALTFEMEPYTWWDGEAGRDLCEYVSGLGAEFVGSYGDAQYDEIPFANGQTADEQAQTVGNSLLLGQYFYINGGYKLIEALGSGLGTPLTSIIDRVDVEMSPQGFFEVVDLTTERQRANFEPERDLERRTMQNSLFDGQEALQKSARDYLRIAAAVKGMSREQIGLLTDFLNGKFTENTYRKVRFDFDGISAFTLAAGTPIWGPAVDTSSGAPMDTLMDAPASYDSEHNSFYGVTIRNGEMVTSGMQTVEVQASGEAVVRVMGPVQPGDPLGKCSFDSESFDYLLKGGTGNVAVAKQAITTAVVKLIKVDLTSFAAGGDTWLP